MSVKDLKPAIVIPHHDEDEELLQETALDQLDYYWDMHPTKEDLMAQSEAQLSLLLYLVHLLRWLYRRRDWFIGGDINIYKQADPSDKNYPIAPDVALFKRAKKSKINTGRLRSWKMEQPNRPAPDVVFEIASKDTWREDLTTKPAQYQQLWVKEYYAYDPNSPQYWKDKSTRLRGWRFEAGQIIEMQPNEQGWLWSEELESWLVPDKKHLRLYDPQGQMRLNEAQEEALAAKLERAARRSAEAELRQERATVLREQVARSLAEAEVVREQAARSLAEAAIQQEQEARQLAEAEARREQAAMQQLLGKLRKKGIDPDSL